MAESMLIETDWEFRFCMSLVVILMTCAFMLGRWSAPAAIPTEHMAPVKVEIEVESTAKQASPVAKSRVTQNQSVDLMTPLVATTQPTASSSSRPHGPYFITNHGSEVFHTSGCRCVADYWKQHKLAPRSVRACSNCGP
jgi:hypothetical protein